MYISGLEDAVQKHMKSHKKNIDILNRSNGSFYKKTESNKYIIPSSTVQTQENQPSRQYDNYYFGKQHLILKSNGGRGHYKGTIDITSARGTESTYRGQKVMLDKMQKQVKKYGLNNDYSDNAGSLMRSTFHK